MLRLLALACAPGTLLASMLYPRVPVIERLDFWRASRGWELTTLQSDASLPPLEGNHRSVAVCITGSARMFPDPDYHIVSSLTKNLVGGMQANRTDFFLHLQLAERPGEQRASGEHAWRMSDLDGVFAELRPKRAIIQPEPPSGCVDGIIQQFLKMDKCMDLVRETEAEDGFRYDCGRERWSSRCAACRSSA